MVDNYPCPLIFKSYVTPTLWVWAGLSDSLLTNKRQQEWGHATSKIRSQESLQLLSLTQKQAAMFSTV